MAFDVAYYEAIITEIDTVMMATGFADSYEIRGRSVSRSNALAWRKMAKEELAALQKAESGVVRNRVVYDRN